MSEQPQLPLFDDVSAPESKPSRKQYKIGEKYELIIKQIRIDPELFQNQPEFSESDELVCSIRHNGVIVPVFFQEDSEGEAVLVAGARRLKAAERAGYSRIPAICVDQDPLLISFLENMMRKNMTPVEKAEAFARIMERGKFKKKGLASQVGISPQSMSDLLRVAKLPEEIRSACRHDLTISQSILVQISRLGSEKAQLEFFKRYQENRPTRAQVRAEQKGRREIAAKPRKEQTFIVRFEKRLESIDVSRWDPSTKESMKESLRSTLQRIGTILRQLDEDYETHEEIGREAS